MESKDERYQNIDTALSQIRTGKGIDPSLIVTDGTGTRLENPTKDQLTELKHERNRVLWHEQNDNKRKQNTGVSKSEKAQKAVYLKNSIIADAFSPSWWKDDKGKLMPLPQYNTPDDLVNALIAYEKSMAERIASGDEIIPDAEGLCVFLRISTGTLKGWRKGERGEAFRDIIEVELSKIAAIKNQLAMREAIPQVVWATMMNNVHGYTQAKSVELEVTAKRTPESPDALIQSAKLLP